MHAELLCYKVLTSSYQIMPTIHTLILAILGPLASYKVIILNFLNSP
jgi:hypothetical protein